MAKKARLINPDLKMETHHLIHETISSSSKRVSIFLGSRLKEGDDITPAQIKVLAEKLAQEEYSIVYGGERGAGLMHLLAEAACKAGGNVIGVPYPDIRDRVEDELTNTVVYTDSLQQRLDVLTRSSTTFIACVGGPGTLEELCTVFNKYPQGGVGIYLLNTGNFWNIPKEYFKHNREDHCQEYEEDFQSFFRYLEGFIEKSEKNIAFKNFKSLCVKYNQKLTTVEGLLEVIQETPTINAASVQNHGLFSPRTSSTTISVPEEKAPADTLTFS